MVRPHAYLNGGVTHLVQQAQWAFFNTACSLPLFPGTPNANTNAGGNKSCWNAQHRIERFNWLGEQICKFIGKNRKGLRKYKNTQMKTATITTSIIVQRREEDQDCDAKEKKKLTIQSFGFLYVSQRTQTYFRSSPQFSPSEKWPFAKEATTGNTSTAVVFCAPNRDYFANCSAVFFFLSFLFLGSVKFQSRREAICRVL